MESPPRASHPALCPSAAAHWHRAARTYLSLPMSRLVRAYRTKAARLQRARGEECIGYDRAEMCPPGFPARLWRDPARWRAKERPSLVEALLWFDRRLNIRPAPAVPLLASAASASASASASAPTLPPHPSVFVEPEGASAVIIPADEERASTAAEAEEEHLLVRCLQNLMGGRMRRRKAAEEEKRRRRAAPGDHRLPLPLLPAGPVTPFTATGVITLSGALQLRIYGYTRLPLEELCAFFARPVDTTLARAVCPSLMYALVSIEKTLYCVALVTARDAHEYLCCLEHLDELHSVRRAVVCRRLWELCHPVVGAAESESET